jgi:hypothetical protein
VHLCWRQASLRLFPAGCILLLLGGLLLWVRLARLGPFFFFLLGCSGLPFMCCLGPSRLRFSLSPPVPSRLFLAVRAWPYFGILPFLPPETVMLARLEPSFFRLGWAETTAFWGFGIFFLVVGQSRLVHCC